ncbi:uncharacterized protein F4822DRAFT_62566 [Hypoxylon trugodes]|uniref:uncharacterized protein n=1 Tax=Hypoxylon trugodes TaxID=326681 RepID=UPI00219AB935|nr:uncharacterized protein F4822DRAFT_62566 [Hypoxylon trugodes]KAI1384147.1 hypothetical protein F4822DRAFT_62566 [Hypoxylon trugodes]
MTTRREFFFFFLSFFFSFSTEVFFCFLFSLFRGYTEVLSQGRSIKSALQVGVRKPLVCFLRGTKRTHKCPAFHHSNRANNAIGRRWRCELGFEVVLHYDRYGSNPASNGNLRML